MDLSPRQLGILHEIGVPLWELRSDDVELPSSHESEEVLEHELIALDTDVLILLDSKEQHQAAMNLLAAMLKAIGLSFNNVTILNQQHLHQVKSSVSAPKLLLVMGEQANTQLMKMAENGSSEINHVFSNYFNNVSLLVTLGLDDLLATPSKKQIAWQGLLEIKHYLDNRELHA